MAVCGLLRQYLDACTVVLPYCLQCYLEHAVSFVPAAIWAGLLSVDEIAALPLTSVLPCTPSTSLAAHLTPHTAGLTILIVAWFGFLLWPSRLLPILASSWPDNVHASGKGAPLLPLDLSLVLFSAGVAKNGLDEERTRGCARASTGAVWRRSGASRAQRQGAEAGRRGRAQPRRKLAICRCNIRARYGHDVGRAAAEDWSLCPRLQKASSVLWFLSVPLLPLFCLFLCLCSASFSASRSFSPGVDCHVQLVCVPPLVLVFFSSSASLASSFLFDAQVVFPRSLRHPSFFFYTLSPL